MVWTVKTPFLIICILVLDLLLIGDIISNNKTEVLGAKISKKIVNVKIIPLKKVKSKSATEVKSVSASITPSPSISSKSLSEAPAKAQTVTPTKESEKEQDPSISGNTSDLLTQINSFRSSKGLSALSAHSDVCFFANMRAQEISTSFNHDGFTNRINSKTLPYSSYSEVAENIAMNPDPGKVIQGWIDSPGHNSNMSKDVPYGCVVGNGNYYVFEAWKP